MTRIEPCVCGGRIVGGAWENSRPLVEAHNRSLLHMAWRWHAGIITPSFDGAASDDPRRQWPTAEDDPRDVSGNTQGASVAGVEGVTS